MAKIREIVAATVSGETLYLIMSIYTDGAAAEAVGQVIRTSRTRGGSFACELNTTNQLRTIWSSPGGSLWVGSSDGNMWTTADVDWPETPDEDTEVDTSASELAWKAVRLPNMRAHAVKPIMTAIWGTSDDNVFVGTFEGGIYRWDGTSWDQVCSDITSAIHRIHGSGADSVYAVGEDGTILHFDGTRWHRLACPSASRDGLTGVWVDGRDDALLCGRSGRVLRARGTRAPVEVVCELEAALYGIVRFAGRPVLAAGDAGVWALTEDGTAEVLRNTFAASGIFEGGEAIYFVQPTQDHPSIIDHHPGLEAKWWRSTF